MVACLVLGYAASIVLSAAVLTTWDVLRENKS